MTQTTPPLPTPKIDDVIECLRRALVANDPVVWTMLALDALTYIGDNFDPAALDAGKMAKTGELMTFLTPRLAEHLMGSITATRICLTFNAAYRLLLADDDGLRFDRKLHVSLLAADLKGMICRSRLKERGDPLTRDARLQTAWNTLHLPSAPTQ